LVAQGSATIGLRSHTSAGQAPSGHGQLIDSRIILVVLTQADLIEVTLRLLTATIIGFAIGFDREMHRKPAGMRTHALVSLGAALLMIIVVFSGPRTAGHIDAMSRVIQGIIAGVGFLGGGAILKSSTGPEMVHGLTTAATIWVTASLGVACGAGQWSAGVVAGTLAILIVIAGRPIEGILHRKFNKQNGATPDLPK
jgi:putative Mg2+ transporter-C (MgtC) family protein